MRRLLGIASVLLATGCRAPAIPAQPSPHEYALYSAWFEQASAALPPQLTFAVDPNTLILRQNELQFQQCLPRRMEDVFNSAAPATLLYTSGNDWLNLSDGRSSALYTPGLILSFARPTEFFQISRVAFTRSGYDAYVWIQHRTCHNSDSDPGCGNMTGSLVHGVKSDGSWKFQETTCQITVLPG